MFKKNNYTVIEDLYLSNPVVEEVKWTESFFDREGYELNAIEKEFYASNQIPILVEERQTTVCCVHIMCSSSVITCILSKI